jgi:hypothetical protein
VGNGDIALPAVISGSSYREAFSHCLRGLKLSSAAASVP